MNPVFVFIFFLIASNTFGQRCYLNSEEIDLENVFISRSSIDEIRVDGQKGEGYIITNRPVVFTTLSRLLKEHTEIDDSINEVIYVIKNRLINDKSKVKIDTAFFIRIDVKKFDKIIYIDERHRNLILAEVELFEEKPKPLRR